MAKSRFNGTETDVDKAFKLAGSKYPISQGILMKLLLYTSPLGNMYMNMIDQLGLYGNRIEMLFVSCDRNMDKFIDTLQALSKQGVCQDRIISMKTQEDFNILVKEDA